MVLSFGLEEKAMAVRVRKDDEARVPVPPKQPKTKEIPSAVAARDPRVAGLQGMGYSAAAERLKPGKDGAAQAGLQTDHLAASERILRLYLLPRLEPVAADRIRAGLDGTLKTDLLNQLVQVFLGSADAGRRLLDLASQGDVVQAQLDALAVQLHASISEALQVLKKWLARHMKALGLPEQKGISAPAPAPRKKDNGLLDQPVAPEPAAETRVPAATDKTPKAEPAGKTQAAATDPQSKAPTPKDEKTRKKTPA
jgi:hypothetical protein